MPAISSSMRLRAAGHLEAAARAAAAATAAAPPSPPSAACPASAPRSASTRGSSARRSRSTPCGRRGRPSPSNGCAEQLGVGGIGVERHALVHDLLADLVCRRPACENGLAAFVGVARVERADQQRHEIADRLRLEHHRVEPGLDRRRDSATPPPSARRMRPSAAGVDRRSSRARRRRPAGPVPSGVRTVVESSASVVAVVGEQPVARRDRPRAGVRLEEAGDEQSPAALPPRGGSITRRAACARASASRSAVRLDVSRRRSCSVCGAELRHQLRIFGRQLREPLGEIAPCAAATASSSTFVVAEARRWPIVLVTVTRRVGDAAGRRDLAAGEARVAAPRRSSMLTRRLVGLAEATMRRRRAPSPARA